MSKADKGDGSVWHASRKQKSRLSILWRRWDPFLACQTEPSPLSLVEVELVEEVFHVAAVLLGGTAQAGVAFDEAGYAVHFQEIVLVLGGDVLHHVGDEFGADAILDALQNAEGVGYGRLADLDDVAFVHHFGWLDLDVVYGDAALLAGFGGDGSGLENTHGPEPLVNTSLSHNLLLIIELAHGIVDTGQAEVAHSLDSHRNALVKYLALLFTERIQHKLDLGTHGKIIADTKTQSCELLGAENLDDIAYAVVSAAAALFTKAYLAKRQSQVIGHNQEILRLYVLLVHPVADGVSAQVHKGSRFEEHKLAVLDAHVSDKTVTLVLKNSIGRLCEGVQYHKSYVVAGILVFVARVTQPHNQILHIILLLSSRSLSSGSLSSRCLLSSVSVSSS